VAAVNFITCPFETTEAISKEVSPLIDRIARKTAELKDTTFKVAKETTYHCPATMGNGKIK
jgi:hypothetical protein